MNTPEHATKNSINENIERYIDILQTRLIQNQTQRIQGRDYGRILRGYNTPAQWYRASPITRSIYYYDPLYQKYLQQQSKSITNLPRISSPIRVANQSKSYTKYTTNLHNPSKPIFPSRSQSISTLPPIIRHKKPNDE